MFNEILAGIFAGSGWLIGIPLYKWTKEEINPWANKFKISFNQMLIFSAILSASIFAPSILQFSYEINIILLFIISILFSSLYSVNKKPKHQVMFFIIHIGVFLAAYFLAQSF